MPFMVVYLIGEHMSNIQTRHVFAEVRMSFEITRVGTSTEVTERAWAAGFFDGEGYIGIRGDNHCLVASITQVGTIDNPPDTLIRFQYVIGFGDIKPKPDKRENRQPTWEWKITSRMRVYRMLDCIGPYLSAEKLAQACNALERWNNRVRLWKKEVARWH